MAVKFDTLEGTALTQQGVTVRTLRGVTVTDIPAASSTNDPDMLMNARSQVEAAAGSNYPGHPELFFSGLFIRGFTTDGVFGYAIYETFQTGGPPSAYVVRDKTYVQSIYTSFVPGTREPIMTAYTGAGTYAGIAQGMTVTPMRFMLPCRAFEVSGLVYGVPTSSPGQWVWYVNSPAWGPPGEATLPIGYWMFVNYETQISKYAGYYTYQATLIANKLQDWSVMDVIRNPSTGRYVIPSTADVSSAVAATYRHGYIWGDSGHGGNQSGIVRIGGNPTVSIASIIGF